MRQIVETKLVETLDKGDFVVVSRNDGLLVIRAVTGIERLDNGKWIEVGTDDGLRRLVGKGDQIVVLRPT